MVACEASHVEIHIEAEFAVNLRDPRCVGGMELVLTGVVPVRVGGHGTVPLSRVSAGVLRRMMWYVLVILFEIRSVRAPLHNS